MSATLNFLELWMEVLASASWQVALLIVAVAAATMLLRRSRPMVRYALWGVVLLRLCLPFGFTSPLGMAGFSHWSYWSISSTAEVAQSTAVPRGLESLTEANVVVGTATEAAAHAAPSGRSELRLAIWMGCGIVWLLGVAILGVVVFQRWSRLQRIVDASEPCRRPELIALLNEMRDRLGVAREVSLRTLPPGADGLGPCAAGWRRPRILLPVRLEETWDLATLEPILIHELAHIRRGDILVNAVQVLLQLIYWFHPLVWMANARLRRERELICDDFAVLHSGATSRRYGATILRAMEEVRMESGWSFAGVGMGESGLSQRLRRLLDGSYMVPRPVGRAATGTVLFAGMVGVLIASDAPRRVDTAVPRKTVDGTSQNAPGTSDSAADTGNDKLAQNTAGEKKPGNTVGVPKPDPGAMFTKEWKIPVGLMAPAPPRGTANPALSPLATELSEAGDGGMAREWLISKGIVFNGRAAALETQKGTLIVRNTQAQLDLIDALIEAFVKTNGVTAPVAAAGPSDAGDPVIPKLELRESTPAEAFTAITAATGIKIFYTPPAGGDQARITLSLTNVPAMEAFRYVTALANLKFTSEKDGVHVSAN